MIQLSNGLPVPGPTGAGPGTPAKPVTLLRPRSGWQAINLGQLWKYRELLAFLVWRDIKVRYKQTALGAAWALLQPAMTMVVFTVFFGRFGGMAKHVTVPYPVFILAALLPWQYFAAAVGQSGNSLVSNANLIKKIYFPRLIIPLSAAGVPLVDFAVSTLLLAGALAYYGVVPSAQIVLIPLFMVVAVAAAIGVGTLLAALVIAYRDFRYVLGFLTQLWMFATPVAYPLSVVPEKYHLVYAVNPMVGVIEGCRAAVFGGAVPWAVVGVSALSAAGLLVAGPLYFRRVERRFADIV